VVDETRDPPETRDPRRADVPLGVQFAGLALVAVGFGVLAVWAGLVVAGVAVFCVGLALELAGRH
jgi:hypothetical protein